MFPLTLIGLLAASAAASPTEKPEFRGMWISAWQAGLLTPEQIDESIRMAKIANLNALIVQVRKAGDAYYKSDYEPVAENIEPDFDALEYIIEKAHAAGLEVHAWLNTYKIWQGRVDPISPDHLFNSRKEWLNKGIAGDYSKSGQYALDPGIPEVQEHVYKVYMDVVRKYDIDGIHFDYVRYWDNVYGYSDLAVARFNKETGRSGIPEPTNPAWMQWRRDRVTDLVRQIYEGVQKTKPHVKVTAAVVCSQKCTPEFKDSHPYNRLLQDWERWLKEGIIDAVIPMNYKSERNPEDAQLFREWIDQMVRLRHGRHAYNGMYTRDMDGFVAQIKATRERGADGVVGFAFNRSMRREALAMTLREKAFPAPVPVPPMPWKPTRVSGGPDALNSRDLLALAIYHRSKKHDLDKAIEVLEQAVEKDPSFAEGFYRLGQFYLAKGMKQKAAERFRETLKIKPAHGGAIVGLRRLDI